MFLHLCSFFLLFSFIFHFCSSIFQFVFHIFLYSVFHFSSFSFLSIFHIFSFSIFHFFMFVLFSPPLICFIFFHFSFHFFYFSFLFLSIFLFSGARNLFLDSAISPPIPMSCSSHTQVCDELGTTDGVTSLTDDFMHIDDMRTL